MSIKSNLITLLTKFTILITSLFTINFTIAEEARMWAEGYCNGAISQGANRYYYNRGALMKWRHPMGDWRDKNGIKQGDTPWAVINIADLDDFQTIQTDVTTLAADWHSGKYKNQGFFLKGEGPKKVSFYTKEADDILLRPQLAVQTDTASYNIAASADTAFRLNTYTCKGADKEIDTYSANLLFYFDLSEIPNNESITQASLILKTTQNQYANVSLSVYRVDIETKSISNGSLASRFPNDYTIAFNTPGIFSEPFESENWQHNWTYTGPEQNLRLITKNNEEGFVPLMGKALEVTMPDNDRTALSAAYLFADKIGQDVEEVYFRYYLRFGRSWQTILGGKLPGIAGTYAGENWAAGWGGRTSNGTNGWSARGVFELLLRENNPYSNKVPIGNYIYHANQIGSYGDVVVWDGEKPGVLEKEKWYAIEQYVKMNTPGENDGILRTWIDGTPSYERTDLKFRNIGYEHIKIDRVWMNLFHGGTQNNDRVVKAFIDNVVIAYEYIGPIKFDTSIPIAGQEPNRRPVIEVKAPNSNEINAQINQTIDFDINTHDPDGHGITIEWLLNGEIIANDVKQYSFTPTIFQLGTHQLRVRVTDTKGGHNEHSWQVILDPAKWQEISITQDTTIVKHSYGSQGKKELLRITQDQRVFLRFSDLPNLSSTDIKSAWIVLYDEKQFGDINVSTFSTGNSWFEGESYHEGSTRDYIDYAQKIYWNNQLGDWIDAAGVENGLTSYSQTFLPDTNVSRFIAIEATALIKEQISLNELNLVLYNNSSAKQDFHSREHADNNTHPKLLIETH